jgi:hypothetical protein
MAHATLEDLKQYLDIKPATTADDALLTRLLAAASAFMDSQTARDLATDYTEIPADITQAVIELAALKYRDRLRVGKSTESMGGMSVGYLPSMTPASVLSVIDAYRRLAV